MTWYDKHVHEFSEPWYDEMYGEFLPGWYFADEVGALHGPFDEREEAVKAILKYVNWLDTGETIQEEVHKDRKVQE